MTLPDELWLPPPVTLTLPNDDVHVWRAALDMPSARMQALQRILAPDEARRAEAFYFERDSVHYIVRRGLLRTILGRYMQRAPDRIQFHYNAYGKPALSAAHRPHMLRFNVSYSDGLVLYAIAHNREVGIDVERIRTNRDHMQIAAATFSLSEYAQLVALSDEAQLVAFFNGWTRKEAYVKAKGIGLSLPLDQFSVSLTPGEPARLVHFIHTPQEAARWSLQELPVGSDYAAAIAVEGNAWRLKCWQWQE